MVQADIVQQSQDPDWPNLNFSHPASPQTQTDTPRRSRFVAPSQSSACSAWGGVGKVFWVLLIFAVLGIEPRAPGMLGEHSTTGMYLAPNLQGSNTYALEKKLASTFNEFALRRTARLAG